MSLDELKAICPVFEEDIYEEISMETCCLIVVVAVIGLIIYSISSSVSEKNAEKEKKIKNYKNALANGKSNVNSQMQYAKNCALNFFDENTQ